MVRQRRYFRPIQDETVISTLVYLRDVIVRDDLEGLEHVEALLRLRNCEPESQPTPKKWPKHFKKGELRREVLNALRTGPKTGREIATIVHERQTGLEFRQTYKRVYICLNTLKNRRIADHLNGMWRRAG